MIKVTFVCLGNICRSPMAELIFKDMLARRGMQSDFTVDSCGTSGWEAGNPVYPSARNALARHGIAGTHTARKITQADIENSDYLLVMDGSNYDILEGLAKESDRPKIHKLLSFTGSARDIADPWYTRDFETAYRDIEAGCAAFLDWVLKN